jgi:hypothetical protein
MILLAFRHGLRVSELIALRWDMVDLDAGLLHVARLKHGMASSHPLRGPEVRGLRLHILLGDRLHGHAAYSGPFDGLTDTRCIVGIIFLTLHIRFDELWRHQFHPVAKLGKLPRPVMGPTGGRHPKEAGRQLCDERQELLPGEPFLHDDVPVGINAMDAHNVLGDPTIGDGCRAYHHRDLPKVTCTVGGSVPLRSLL